MHDRSTDFRMQRHYPGAPHINGLDSIPIPGSPTVAGACASRTLDTRRRTLNAEIWQLLGTISLALGVAVTLCEAGSRCAAVVTTSKRGRQRHGDHELVAAAEGTEGDTESSEEAAAAAGAELTLSESGDEEEVAGERTRVLGATTEASDAELRVEEPEPASDRPTSSGERGGDDDNDNDDDDAWWYTQALGISLWCNVFNVMLAIGLPLFGWWGLSSAAVCVELRRTVCALETCSGSGTDEDCGQSTPWPQVFWSCLILTPFVYLSTAVFLHAVCSGRISSHDW